MVEACKRALMPAQSSKVLEMKVGTETGSREAIRDRASGVGTMTIGRTQESGFRCGSNRARDGRPGSTESQVEQTSASGWALRPESERVTEVVKERIGL